MSYWQSPAHSSVPAPWSDEAIKPSDLSDAARDRIMDLAARIYAASTDPKVRSSPFPEDCIIYAMRFEERANQLGWRK